MARRAPEVTLSDDQRQALLSLSARASFWRAPGAQNKQVTHELGATPVCRTWGRGVAR